MKKLPEKFFEQNQRAKRENENFRNRSGIVYLESSFDMISIKQKKE